MKIFNKFKGNKDTEQSNLVENGDYTKPEALSQIRQERKNRTRYAVEPQFHCAQQYA